MKKLIIAQYFPEINKALNAGYRYKDINENGSVAKIYCPFPPVSAIANLMS